MSIRKDRKMTTLTQRDVSRMISINTQIPLSEIELAFKSLSEIIILAADKGYTLNLPGSIGIMEPRLREAHKEGDIVPIYGTLLQTQEDLDRHNSKTNRETDIYFGEDGIVYAKYIKDTIEFNYPHFRTLRSSIDKSLVERKKQNAKNYV